MSDNRAGIERKQRTLLIPHSVGDGTHKYLNGTNFLADRGALAGGLHDAQGLAEISLRHGRGKINFVSKDKEGNSAELISFQQRLNAERVTHTEFVDVRLD